MKKNLPFLFFAVIVMLFSSCNRQEIVVYDISPDRFLFEYSKAKESDADMLILDTRSDFEYSIGHFNGAINIPLKQLPVRIEEIADLKDATTFVYDLDVDKSFEAVKILAKNGFTKIFNCPGTEEYEYEYVLYNTIRIQQFVEMAKTGKYTIIDYRIKSAYERARIPGAVLVEYGSLDNFLKEVPFSYNGFLVYSTNEASAGECAQKMNASGISKIYVCKEGIMDYTEYLTEKD